MTIFFGFVLLMIIHDVLTSSHKWWRFALSALLAIVVACFMMLAYWDWHPSW